MADTPTILWFRRDLRLADNPALNTAGESGNSLLPIFIHDPAIPEWPDGAASRWWLHHSLTELDRRLRDCGSRLLILQGEPLACLQTVIEQTGAQRCIWSRQYEPAALARDRQIETSLTHAGIDCASVNAGLLLEPWEVQTKTGTPYRVFTPFWKQLQGRLPPRSLIATPAALPPLPRKRPQSLTVKQLGLLPAIPWDRGFHAHWQPGETGAWQRWSRFAERIQDYPVQRDMPWDDGVSGLSPHLHFGEISPVALSHALQPLLSHRSAEVRDGAQAWVRQLAWRDFAHHLLYHFPRTVDAPLDSRFEQFPWEQRPADLRAWQQGRTGIPIIDAGMRELWGTGWMHNRVRMLVASFLTKHLRIHWLEGAHWFWDTLVDADLANNTLGWQWTAGCGADAAPFFRIFNPVTQGERFDPDGSYVRRWLPELAKLPAKWVHKPWQAPEQVLRTAGVDLDKNYPRPIVDLAEGREAALAAWEQVKQIPR